MVQGTPWIAIAPLGFLVLIAVVFLVVVAAILSGRNRGALGVLGAVVGFGFVGLVGLFLLSWLLYAVHSQPYVAHVEEHLEGGTIVVESLEEPPRVPEPAAVAPAAEIKLGETTAGGPQSSPPSPPAPIEAPKAEAEAPPATGPTAGESAATVSPSPRPKWMDEPQGKHGSDSAYHKIASVELYRSRAECEEALPAALREAVKEYIDQFLGEKGAAELVALPVSDIHDQLVKAQWEEHTSDLLGPIVNLHALLVFDGKVNAMIKQRHQQARVAERLTTSGVGAGLLLGLLGTVFGYLKLDTLTRGYYSRRLQFAAGSVILTLAAIVALLARGKLGF